MLLLGLGDGQRDAQGLEGRLVDPGDRSVLVAVRTSDFFSGPWNNLNSTPKYS